MVISRWQGQDDRNIGDGLLLEVKEIKEGSGRKEKTPKKNEPDGTVVVLKIH